MKIIILLIFLSSSVTTNGQVSSSKGLLASIYSMEIAKRHAKVFLLNNVLNGSENGSSFKMGGLVSASAGGLSTLSYVCSVENKKGILLGFYGNRITESGLPYVSYGFKNLDESEALELLTELKSIIEQNKKTLKRSMDNHIAYVHKDVRFVAFSSGVSIDIYVTWNGFTSRWKFSELKSSLEHYNKFLLNN